MVDSIGEPETLVPGRKFAERYELKSLLGEGAVGKVYLAYDTMLESDLALKVLNPSMSNDEQVRNRFLREVKVAQAVTHPNVVRAYDVGFVDQQLFMTMEYIQGETLSHRISRGVPPFQEALGFFVQTCEGLRAIHHKDVIHRDLKPTNLIIDTQGRVKISDFGVAKVRASEITMQDELVGSASHMPPEIWRHEELDIRTDIYALGVVCYELFTGLLPFRGETLYEMMWGHIHSQPVPPRELNSEIPEWLSALILKMLGKKKVERPECVDEILETIEEGNALDLEERQFTVAPPVEDSHRYRPPQPRTPAEEALELQDDENDPEEEHERAMPLAVRAAMFFLSIGGALALTFVVLVAFVMFSLTRETPVFNPETGSSILWFFQYSFLPFVFLCGACAAPVLLCGSFSVGIVRGTMRYLLFSVAIAALGCLMSGYQMLRLDRLPETGDMVQSVEQVISASSVNLLEATAMTERGTVYEVTRPLNVDELRPMTPGNLTSVQAAMHRVLSILLVALLVYGCAFDFLHSDRSPGVRAFTSVAVAAAILVIPVALHLVLPAEGQLFSLSFGTTYELGLGTFRAHVTGREAVTCFVSWGILFALTLILNVSSREQLTAD